MARLTKRNQNGVAYMAIADTLSKRQQEIEGSKPILEALFAMFQKLAYYEDKEEGRGKKIITLCGSTKFKDEFEKSNKDLTLQGNIVISVGLFGHSGDIISDDQKLMLDEMHKRKIDLADEIFVINVGGYIGSSTRSEIEYAIRTGKGVRYLESEDE